MESIHGPHPGASVLCQFLQLCEVLIAFVCLILSFLAPYCSHSSPSSAIFFLSFTISVLLSVYIWDSLHLELSQILNVRTQNRKRGEIFVSRDGFMVIKRTNTARPPESSRRLVLRSSPSSLLLLFLLLLLLFVITLTQAKRWRWGLSNTLGLLGLPEVEASRIYRVGTWRWEGCQPYSPAAFTPRRYPSFSFLYEA